MNNIKNILVAVSLSILLTTTTRCKPKAKGANVTVNFVAKANGKTVVIGDGSTYNNALGQSFNLSVLRYYLHNFKLQSDNGNTIALDKYILVDHAIAAKTKIDLGAVPAGNYTSWTMDAGVDNVNNSSGTQDGDLDPGKGMFWTWNSGYIFFKHEGKWNGSQPLLFHMGNNACNVPAINLPMDNMIIDGVDRKLNVILNLDKLYGANWDFNTYNNIMSGSNDNAIMAIYKVNMSKAFSLTFE
jgi:hypothetical protein